MTGIDAYAHLASDRENDDREEPDYIRCYWCEQWMVDGEGERIAWMYGHPKCRAAHDDILAHGLMDELTADEARDDA